LVFIALIVVAASAAIYWASLNANKGVYWADRICRETQLLCDDPRWLLIAVAAVIVAALIRQAMKG